ncbi:MAG: hypothetical protein QG675_701 [Patescibacteria group bacterium]|jgi:hypothetical protein|nr:hypothetical protein [Patescibacteria group bacterium]
MPSRSEISSPVFQEATEVLRPDVSERLVQQGSLVRLSDIDQLWHGRKNGTGKKWLVNPYHDSKGSHNVYSYTFYATPHHEDAEAFAKVRAGSEPKTATVEQIRATDKEWFVVRHDCTPEEGVNLVRNISLSEGLPTEPGKSWQSLAARYIETTIAEALEINGSHYINRDKRTLYAIRETSLYYKPKDVELTDWNKAIGRYIQAFNSKQMIAEGKIALAGSIFLSDRPPFVSLEDRNSKDTSVALSRKYMLEVFRRAHIVGIQSPFRSGNLGRRIEDVVALWNMSAVQQIEAQSSFEGLQSSMLKGYENFFSEFSTITNPHARSDKPRPPRDFKDIFDKLNSFETILDRDGAMKLRNVLQDHYSSPAHIIDTAKEISPDLRMLLESGTGTWEGYTLEQHTEAVLGMFERYYAYKIPAELVGFIKTFLFMQDIGKSLCVQIDGDKKRQALYNSFVAEKLLLQMGYQKQTVDLVLSLMGEGSDLISDVNVKNAKRIKLMAYSSELASGVLQTAPNKHQASLFAKILNISQVCDGSAYTSHASYRKDGERTRSQGSFDDSFEVARRSNAIRVRRPKK